MHPAAKSLALAAILLAGGLACATLIVDAGRQSFEEGMRAAEQNLCRSVAT